MKHIFIINTYAGRYAKENGLREKLKTIEGLDYYVFNVRAAGYEAELVEKLLRYFKEDKVRIYCCGGSGTFCNILNGIHKLDDVEVAFYPCGLTNDFLRVFGDDAVHFYDIEKLINGKAIDIDYVKTNGGMLVNAFTTGLDSKMNEKMEDYRVYNGIGRMLPYVMSMLYAVFLAPRLKYRISIDGEEYDDYYSEVCFGKGLVIGGFLNMAEDTDLRDGQMNVLLAPAKTGFAALRLLLFLIKGDWDNIQKMCVIRKATSVKIEREKQEKLIANLDGEKVATIESWEATVENLGLKFVVPREVNYYG